MKVTVIPLVVRALGKVSKSLEKRLDVLEIRERIETHKHLRSFEILKDP